MMAMRLWKSIKAISSIIAVIILIAITVAGGLLVFALMTSTLTGSNQKTQVNFESLSLYRSTGEPKAVFTATLKNTGNRPIKQLIIHFSNESDYTVPSVTASTPLEPGRTVGVTLTPPKITAERYVVGNAYSVTVEAEAVDGSAFSTVASVKCLGTGKPSAITSTTVTFYSTVSDGVIEGPCKVSYQDAWASPAGSVFDMGGSLVIGQRIGEFFTVFRGFVFFDTSSLPDGAIIKTAALRLCGEFNCSDADFNITIQNGQPDYPHDPMQSEDFAEDNYSGNGGQFSTADFKITEEIDGEEVITEDANTGQKTVVVDNGLTFVIGQTVWIQDDEAEEINRIADIEGNILTMITNLANGYTVEMNGKVVGLLEGKYMDITLNFSGISWINKTGTTKLAIRSDKDIMGIEPSFDEYVAVRTVEETYGELCYGPKLEITYTLPVTPQTEEKFESQELDLYGDACRGEVWVGQTFTPNMTHKLTKVILKLYRVESPTGNVIVSIQNTDAHGNPTGEDLVSKSIPAMSIPEGVYPHDNVSPIEFVFSTQITLEKGTKYAIIVKNLEYHGANGIFTRIYDENYVGGDYIYTDDGGGYWWIYPDTDMYFSEWGY